MAELRPWPRVARNAYGQMVCPVPGCYEVLHLTCIYDIPLYAEQEPGPGVEGAVGDHWQVECIGGHQIFNSPDLARMNGGDETSEEAPEYEHYVVHEIVAHLQPKEGN